LAKATAEILRIEAPNDLFMFADNAVIQSTYERAMSEAESPCWVITGQNRSIGVGCQPSGVLVRQMRADLRIGSQP